MKQPPACLPIEAQLPDLKRILATHPRAVLAAPPGSGKTTLVPLSLLGQDWLAGQKIILLEPRRIAARAAARRMAFLRNEAVGETVGYRIRLERKVGPSTRVEVVTEGLLTRLIQDQPELPGVGLVIFDEFHERSLHADIALALCLDVQEGLRPELRILVMSATLDAAAVSALMGNAPVVTGGGQLFPVETRYRPGKTDGHPVPAVTDAVLTALREDSGSLLVFLPGIREIRGVLNRLGRAALPPSVRVAPLHGGLPGDAQDLAIEPAPAGTRKIVLSTAIAETSLTIEGIRVVIDSGLKRVPAFDVRSGMSRLETIPVDRDTADQRRGRAGRVEPGVCYRLWSEEKHRQLAAHAGPEILNTDLTPLALELAAWGVSDPGRLSWLDAPPAAAFNRAKELLTELLALADGRITAHGKTLLSLGLHPRLGHMVLRAKALGLGEIACDLAAILEERDFLSFPPGRPDADLRLRLKTLCRMRPPNSTAMMAENSDRMTIDQAAARRIRLTADQLKARLRCPKTESPIEACGLLLAFAYPDRIACRRPGETARYRLSSGRGAYFHQIDPLCAEAYLVAASLDGDQREAAIFLAAPVTYDELATHFADRITASARVEWDPRDRAVIARRDICFGKAVLKTAALREIPPPQIAQALCDGIRQEGIHLLPWTDRLRAWQARVSLLRRRCLAGENWPDVSDEALTATLEDWLLPFLSGMTRADHLKRLDLSKPLQSLLSRQQVQALDRLAPTHLTVPSGSSLPIDYTTGDAPVLSVRLQEMFGTLDTPTIAAGNQPLLLHLLSPAGRPVQVTQDLANFWAKTYFDVKKDLMSRYPKHHWPQDPLSAPATRGTKKKRPTGP